jgi:Uma2 family endonuclease
MNVLTKPRMTVDEFLTWADGRPGRYELFRGEVYKMFPEAVGHSATKGAVYIALLASVRRANISCYVLPDGPTVRIDSETAYEPDALVYCGEKVSTRALEIPNPIIVFEVLSPSTQRIDVVRKLADYFRVPSLAHYLIVDPTRPSIIHHARGSGDTIITRIITEGVISLHPPGIELKVGDIYEEPLSS